MEASTTDGNDDLHYLKEKRQQLQQSIETRRLAQNHLINSLQELVPDLVSSLDLSLKVVSAFNGLSYNSNPKPPKPPSTPYSDPPRRNPAAAAAESRDSSKNFPKSATENRSSWPEDRFYAEKSVDAAKALSVVRSMVALCLIERVPFAAIDSAALLRKLEGDQLLPVEKSALLELGGESGVIAAVETALKSLAEENGVVELEEFVVSGKTRFMVLGIDRNRLVKELPENLQQPGGETVGNQLAVVPAAASAGIDVSGAVFGMGRVMARPPEMWLGPGDPHHQGFPGGSQVFPGTGPPPPMMGPRGGPRMMGLMGNPRVMVVPPLHRPPLGPAVTMGVPNPGSKPRTEDDDMKDLEALLNKKSFKEMQKSKTGEELLDLIHRPTAKETAVAAKFKTKGGPNLKEYCSALTKEDCRRQCGYYIACEKVHFRRIIAPHTDITLGDCSFLDTCRHMKTCKYVHYELDPTPDVPAMMMGSANLPPQKPLKLQRAEYCSEVELGEAQWINCDIRTFRMDILGQFGVIMADPPWDIHMELPYGTMADDEMRNLNVPALQTDGLIFLWVTGRAMELGRECLELWGYKRVEELIWVKTNQLQRIIRTGRTGHWLNHSKEHCLVGIKGNPEVNRNIDTDVIVAEVRETSRKPDEGPSDAVMPQLYWLSPRIRGIPRSASSSPMYPMLERISPRTRKLELFARMHNTHAGWMSLGNQLHGVRLVDEGLRARFKAAYPDVEVQPASPPRASAIDAEPNPAQMRNPFVGLDPKSANQFVEPAPVEGYVSEEKPMVPDIEMVG